MKQRVITAIVALILFIPIVLMGGIWIDVLVCAFAAVGISEIFIMKKQIIVSWDFILALLATLTMAVPDSFFKFLPAFLNKYDIFYIFVMLMLVRTVLSKNKVTFDDAGVYTLAALYIGTGFHFMAAIRNAHLGLAILGYVFAVVWSTDIAAYMVGRKIGKHKLWPVISPNKTWEGSIGAVICAVIIAAIYVTLVPTGRNNAMMIVLAFFLSIVGQMGDLVESAYKRFYGVKDSGKILPGHGGILVREFSIGMGPKLFQKMRAKTTYTIRWLPLGGYVRLAGPDDAAKIDPGTTVVLQLDDQNKVKRIDASGSQMPIEGIPVQVNAADLVDALTIQGYENGDEDQLKTYSVDHDATIIEQNGTELLIAPRDTQFQEASVGKKLATNFAGPFMNIVLGFVVFIIWSLAAPGAPTTTVGSTIAHQPAQVAGIKANDEIVAINNKKISNFNQIAAELAESKGKTVEVKVKRDNRVKNFSIKPKANKIDGQKVYQLGFYGKPDNSLGAKISRGWNTSISTTGLIFNAVGNLFRHFSLNKLSGPVGIYSQTVQVSNMGFTYLLAFLAMISINLGIVNLIPIPGLDGGKLLLNLIQLIIRKPIPEDKEAIVDVIGFVILLLLIVAVTGNDIYRYFIK